MNGDPLARPEAPATEGATGPPLPTHVEIHERQQLEVRFAYALGSEAGPQRYTVDTYLFVPRNVGVARSNYPKDEFYGDATALLRLDAAPLALDRLADLTCPDSPLSKLARALCEFRASAHSQRSQPLSVQVKLYAYLFTVGVRAELGALAKAPAARLEEDLEAALARIREALAAYRRTRSAYWPFEAVCHQSFAEEMRASDEYMSLFVDERLTRLVDALTANAALCDGSGVVARCRLRCGDLAREEALYRKKYGYLTLQETGGPAGEYFAYRAGLLKKTVQSALYLDAREVPVDTFVRNAVGAAAAALAAIWATALAVSLPSLTAVDGQTQVVLFTVAVLAYVLKDRIKAVANEQLVPRLRQFDHTKWISGGALGAVGLGMLKARLRESVRFLSDREVPREILQVRRSKRTVRGAEPLAEEVIHYRKMIEAVAADEAKELPRGYWVRDILRLNVRHFLVRLDEPLDQVEYFDLARGGFAHATLPKTYHLNLVLKVTRETAALVQERTEHLKVLLNKEGIVRVEALGESPPRTEHKRTGLKLPFRLRKRR